LVDKPFLVEYKLHSILPGYRWQSPIVKFNNINYLKKEDIMRQIFVIVLTLTLAAFFLQAPVTSVSLSNVVYAEEPEAPAVQEAATVININTAPAEELATLEGIGDAIAQNIVEYRTANGPFATIEDLKNVKGIGEARFEKLKERITVK